MRKLLFNPPIEKGSCFEAAGPGHFAYKILLCSINLFGEKNEEEISK
jgi:hypothetical protein